MLLSRVTEKGAAFQVAIKTWVLQRLSDQGFLKPSDTVRSWSDCGPNLRCKEVLGYHATELILKFKCHQDLNFRLECHGKSKIDGKGSCLRRCKTSVAAKRHIKTLPQLQAASVEDFGWRWKQYGGPLMALEEYHVWQHPCHRDEVIKKLCKCTKASMQVPVRCCYSWRLQMQDIRRVGGVGHDGCTCTSVKLYPIMVPGLARELPGVSPKLCRARVAPAAVGSAGTEATAPVVVAEELDLQLRGPKSPTITGTQI